MLLNLCLAPAGGSAGWGAGAADFVLLLPCHFCLAAVNAAHKIKVQTCFVSDAIPRNNFPGKMNSVSFFFLFLWAFWRNFSVWVGENKAVPVNRNWYCLCAWMERETELASVVLSYICESGNTGMIHTLLINTGASKMVWINGHYSAALDGKYPPGTNDVLRRLLRGRGNGS